EVDQVQAAGALLHPLAGHMHRVVGKHRGVFHAALAEAHAGAVLEIDCGDYQHGVTSFSAPIDKVLQQLQARGMAFFRVELHGKHVATCQGGTKVRPVMTGGGGNLGGGIDKIAVHKVEALILIDTPPHALVNDLVDLILAHMEHLNTAENDVDAVFLKVAKLAGEDDQTVDAADFLTVTHKCPQTHANAQHRLFGD